MEEDQLQRAAKQAALTLDYATGEQLVLGGLLGKGRQMGNLGRREREP
jgi:hypothetical protein